MSAPTIDVIIVTYNSGEHVTDCLEAIAAQKGIEASVWIQDNGSSDDTVAIVDAVAKDNSLQLVLEQDVSNPGYAVAVNRQITKGKADYILVLNPDTRAVDASEADDWLHLCELASNPVVGFVSPVLVTDSGSVDAACARREPSVGRAAGTFADRRISHRAFNGLSYDLPVQLNEGHREVDAVNGAFMLLERCKLDRIGLMDERYWMYAEDLDWCRSARESGLANVCHTDFVWGHAKGGSESGKRGELTSSEFRHSMVLYFEKYHPQSYYRPVTSLGKRLWPGSPLIRNDRGHVSSAGVS